MRRHVLAVFFASLVVGAGSAGEWPMYQADAGRTGYCSESLGDKLELLWCYHARHAPEPAWPTRNREQFDRAFQIVISGGVLYFGSSADGKLQALDAATGVPRWDFFTGGPIRFAPVVWQDRILFTSDDGCLYCLSANDGKLKWKLRAGPRNEMVLGNDRLVSRWPARGGPVLHDGIVYFGAGIWPSEQVFIYAVDPATGKVLWRNDSSGTLVMDQPHPTARARSGIACQGYLGVIDNTLVVPTGRAVPAVFERETGRLQYFHLGQYHHEGGADVQLIDAWLFNDGAVYDTATGQAVGSCGIRIAAHPRYVVGARDGQLVAYERGRFVVTKQGNDRKGNSVTKQQLSAPLWTVDLPKNTLLSDDRPRGAEQPTGPLMGSTAWSRPGLSGAPGAMIVAGDHAVVGGSQGVAMIDLNTAKVIWDTPVEGAVHGLAAAGDRLYVSSANGAIYCFGSKQRKASRPRAAQDDAANQRVDHRSDIRAPHTPAEDYAALADEIIQRAGITEGYCLDTACGDGRLALTLALRTKLHIYATSTDANEVKTARELLDAAGLYGDRVTVHLSNTQLSQYPDYFADLIIATDSVNGGEDAVALDTLRRIQRPDGGLICVGKRGALRIHRRAPLEDAADWTHQNADAANTLCSRDTRVRGPLEMLWYHDTSQVLPSRHGRAPSPLVAQGRMFVEGLNELRAVSIYNGRTLWKFPLDGVLLPFHGEASIGAAWTGSNFCLGRDRVYLHIGKKCLCLDAATGRLVREFATPEQPDGKPGTWGFIATADNMLVGTVADTDYLIAPWASQWKNRGMYSESKLLFAMDAQTGTIRWTYRPKHSLRHNAIAIAQRRVYVIDRPQTPRDELFNPPRVDFASGRRTSAIGTREGRKVGWIAGSGEGRLLALDQDTGTVVWQTDQDVFGTMLAVDTAHDLLLMSYQPAHQATRRSELGSRMAAFRASDGTRVWDVAADYESHPIINGETIYAEPGAWDLLTGKRLPGTFTRSYGCGIPIASRHLLLFRSATLGYCNLPDIETVENYGGIRPGCWIPVIPAGGLVLMPDAASWCTCSYLNQATCALKPRD